MGRTTRWVQLVVFAALVMYAGAALAQATAGYSEYYLPGDELNMFYIFDDLDDTGAATGNMHSVISVVAWSPNTTIYYDHWENGYGFDPNNPGATADETYTLATQGASRTFESANIPSGGPPPAARNAAVTCPGQGNPGNRCYDGGDRLFAAGGPVTVTRAVWTELRGVGNQGDAWEIYPVTPQLTTYVLPFGEDNYATSNTFFTGFQRVYALVQATDDNTTFTVDLDANGTPDILNQNRDATWNNAGDGATVTLQRGQAFLLDRISACSTHVTCTTFPAGGRLNSGAIITGDKTLQVKFVAGRTATTYTARGLSAFPRGFWTNDYYAPFGQAADTGRPTDYYLFNPNASALTINWQGTTTSGSFSIPAGTTQSFNRAIGANPSVPVGSGLYFSATAPFWGVGFGDSTNDLYEWGYSLLPTTFLYKEHFLGWSPGSLPLTTAPTDGNGVYLTPAQDNTVVFVDYQNDGIADQTYTLNRLQQQFIPAGPTGTLEGARFWATGEFSMSYGENADNANTPTPNLDLGYVALPGTDFLSLVLSVKKTANPTVVATAAGSTTTFTLSTKTNLYSLDAVTVVDTLPPNWQFQNNSCTITRPDFTQLTGAAANPTITGAGTVANPYVLTWSTAQTGGNMQPNQEVLITFTGVTTAAFATGTLSQNRVTSTGTRTIGTPPVTQTFAATDFAYVVAGSVQITKTSNAPTPLYPGDTFTYTVTVTNPGAAGTNLLQGVSLYDALPPGLSMVAGTTSLSRSSVGDSFNSNSYALNVGTRNWAGNWVEANDGGNDIRIAGTELELDNSNSNEPTISRAVSLTGATQARLSFRYRTDTGVDAADVFSILGGTAGTGGAFGTTIGTITGITGASTGNVSYDISALIGANTAIRFTFPNNSYQQGTENIFIDDVSITYNVAVTGPNPPDLLSSSALYALVGGQNLVATFNARVDSPFNIGESPLTNTAATTSVQIPAQITASATNIVATPSLLSASVAGRLWLDADGDGVQDLGEPGLDNVLVTLKDQFGTPIATDFTDANGRFLFSGVAPGNGYYVEATAPPDPGGYPTGLTQSFPNGFTNDRSTTFNLAAGQNYNQADLGYEASSTTSTFGDIVWSDADGDGVRDSGEIGISGATLRLYKDANGNGVLDIGTDTLIATTTSASDGSYLFSGITPNVAGTDDFFVTSTTPGGYTASTATQFTFLNVIPGHSYLSADFGFLPTASVSISDRVWYDANANGLFAAETGIGGVTIELLNGSGAVIATTTTASDGTFAFTGLPGGGADYKTRISDTSNILADYYGTTAFAIARERAETNVVANVNRTGTPSYGFNITRAIGDTVFNDANANGTQDAGEAGFAGVTVSLYNDVNGNGVINAGDTLLGTVVTDVNGQYLFTGLANGTYIVSVPALTGYNYIAGGRPDTDGATAGVQLAATIAGGANVLTRDFGFQAATPRSVSGTFWNDANANGAINGGEGRFANVTVEILSSVAGTGTVAVTHNSATVTGTGTTFTNLAAGDPIVVGGVTYRIQSIASNTSLTLTEIYSGSTASGQAWTTRGNPLFTTTTDASGNYSFSNLASASHFIRITDTNGVLTGFGPTWERTEGLIQLSNPADSIELVNLTGGNLTGVDFGFANLNNIPTLVKIRTLDAIQRGTNVTVTWQTAYESRNLGFNVYREVDGTRTRINKYVIGGSALAIKGRAPLAGYAYRFHDTLPSSSAFAQYWVEDIETTGDANFNGPILPRMESADDAASSRFDVRSETNSPALGEIQTDAVSLTPDAGIGVQQPTTLLAATAAQTAQQLDLAGASALKIHVAREGWTRITKAQMISAGYDPGPNPAKISLYCQGLEQPIVVNTAAPNNFQSADSIEFYGLPLDTPSTGARVYWLRKNTADGLRFGAPLASGGSALTGSVPFTYQRIDRNVWVAAATDTGDGENFFGLVVTPNPNVESLTLANVDNAAGTNATVEVALRGATENIQHRVQVELNGNVLGTATFDNTQQRSFTYNIAHALLINGSNSLSFTALAGDNDISVVVSARITYQHLLKADNGLLEVSLPPSRTVTVTDFPEDSVRALDVTNPYAPVPLAVTTAPNGGTFSATFATPSGGSARTILVFSGSRILAAPQLSSNLPSALTTNPKSGQKKADLLIITHRNFMSAATALQTARTAAKTETLVIDVEDIFDEFNFGVRSPSAIRTFLQSTQDWKQKPGYVLFMGDASLDPRGYFGLGQYDFVPTKLIPTLYIKTASDGWFADFTNSGVESLAIGRLPVRTAAEADRVVAKLVDRDRVPPSGEWSKTAIMVADVPETWNFPASVEALKTLFPRSMAPLTKTIAFGSTPSPRTTLINALNSGSIFVNYVGHGSTEVWSGNLFSSNDATNLTNQNRLPFVAAMTCLNATFQEMFTFSLAEALLLAPNGGAIGVWSSSTLTEPGPQLVMNQEFLKGIFGYNLTIGQSILKAKSATGDLDVRRSWNLIGDPTLKLIR
jgi:uncharacterized repeat protein (TIGR01451 family)